jgi:hypothetical protein
MHILIGLITGPKNGADAKIVVAKPCWEAGNMSVITLPALVKGDKPNKPARDLGIINVLIFREPAVPALKTVSIM